MRNDRLAERGGHTVARHTPLSLIHICVKIYWFIMGAAAIACMVPIFWTYFLEDYQRNRILAPYDSSIDPDNTGINWQQNQSKICLLYTSRCV